MNKDKLTPEMIYLMNMFAKLNNGKKLTKKEKKKIKKIQDKKNNNT